MNFSLALDNDECALVNEIIGEKPDPKEFTFVYGKAVRAALAVISRHPELLEEAREAFQNEERVTTGRTYRGGPKGLSKEDYQRALIEAEGNVNRAGFILEVSRTSVYGAIDRYDLYVPGKDLGAEEPPSDLEHLILEEA